MIDLYEIFNNYRAKNWLHSTDTIRFAQYYESWYKWCDLCFSMRYFQVKREREREKERERERRSSVTSVEVKTLSFCPIYTVKQPSNNQRSCRVIA